MNLNQALKAILNDNVKVTLSPEKSMGMINVTIEDVNSGESDTKSFTEEELDNLGETTTWKEVLLSKAGEEKESDGEDTEEV